MPPASAGFDPDLLAKAVAYGGSSGGSGFVARYGYQVATWGGQSQKYNLYSATKGVGSMLTALAVADGRVSVQKQAVSYLAEFGTPPKSNNATWLRQITLDQLLSHTAGFDETGGFEALRFAPGSYYLYSNCGANWLADVLTVRFGSDLLQVLMQRITSPIGVAKSDITWRNNSYRPTTLHNIARREFGSGLNLTASAFARIGHLLLRQGSWNGRQLVPADYLAQAVHSRPSLAGIKDFGTKKPSDLAHYNMLFENNDDGSYPRVPRDMFFFWGKYNNHVFVIPSLDMVIVRIGTAGLGDTLGSVNTLVGNFVSALKPRNNISNRAVRAATSLSRAETARLSARGPVDRAD